MSPRVTGLDLSRGSELSSSPGMGARRRSAVPAQRLDPAVAEDSAALIGDRLVVRVTPLPNRPYDTVPHLTTLMKITARCDPSAVAALNDALLK